MSWYGSNYNPETVKRGDILVDAFIASDYGGRDGSVNLAISKAVPEIFYEWDEALQDMVEYDDGVSWRQEALGSGSNYLKFPENNMSCCTDYVLAAEIGGGTFYWYSDRNSPPPIPGDWSWAAGGYYCWIAENIYISINK